MDFVILKVNGQDVSNSSHEEAVRCFQSAQEPIVVEVLRRYPSEEREEERNKQQQQQTSAEEKTFTLLVSTGVQTDWAGLIDDEHANNDSFDDLLGHEIDFEEVTLRRSASAEKLGLTVCYSSAGSGSEDADTEVYISEIVPESLAARDGRLREGDQILRVNGKDVASKEQTENLFAETKSDVTILVSRCLYTDDDEDDRRCAYQESSPTPEATTPAYQNSMIEQLIRQQQEIEEQTTAKELEPSPPVPSHTKSEQLQQRKNWMQEALKDCARRVDSIKVSGSAQQVKLVEAYSNHVWSDTEHIYETIPESDSEPIYSSPYEHRHWQQQQQQPNNNVQAIAGTNKQTSNGGKPWHSSSKSNSSGEEKDSSSAYNTGESCNSNTLTLELQQATEQQHPSTLVLCPPRAALTSTPKFHCKPSKSQGSRRGSQPEQQQQQTQQQQQQQQHVLAAETMYTNVANLQQTMRLQQQLFKQALNRRKQPSRESCYARRSRPQPTAFQAPSLAQYQFVASHQVAAPSTPASCPQQPDSVQMEWKVKRRPDGTRYIAWRPVRNRILRNRALRINEERQGHTTEDDAMSEIKIGRYWSKEERRRQLLERTKERKQRQQELLLQQQQQQANEQLICDYAEDSKTLKNPANSHKTPRKKPVADGFTTVQEMIVHGNRVGSSAQNPAGKLMGLLSVTTV